MSFISYWLFAKARRVYRIKRKSNIDFLEDPSIVLNTKTESMPAACEADIRLDRKSDHANARWNFRSHIGQSESP
jgi:hypothetical protein